MSMASNTQHGKRQRGTSDSESDVESQNAHWARFIIVTGGEPLKKLHGIAICKGIEGMAGKPKNIKRLRSGDLLVEVTTSKHSLQLLRTTSLAGVKVECTPHRSLNSCKGVVRSYESIECSDEELKEWLAPQGVTDVHRVTTRKTGILKPTPVLFLTFSGNKLPSSVTVGFENCRVSVYVPNPLRCFKCQAFGHHKNTCKKPERCSKCGSTEHHNSQETPCTSEAKCVNCDGNHASYSRDCPVWKKEQEVQKLKTTRNISYPEARKLVYSSQPTFASVVATPLPKPKCSTIATQTDIIWLQADTYKVDLTQSTNPATPPTKTQSTSTSVTNHLKLKTSLPKSRSPSRVRKDSSDLEDNVAKMDDFSPEQQHHSKSALRAGHQDSPREEKADFSSEEEIMQTDLVAPSSTNGAKPKINRYQFKKTKKK